ncbi:uncharacterized protein F4822DRAFT_389698 [Hypoxylon trugodes]|uniref:uncharacterized protein n=1 Tax=Hypoxylon trugodes TaxID=326681 RepID=UPI00219D43DF|nr:uncharacterized protein F4822DRAFT_389698 [Hypoxylon trugodes]KAI1392137.1 hypothetical protein F4822DRAFT_389698 [Hypoxylon trugodes]
MALTTDNIINIVALVIMSVPGLWLILKFIQRQWDRIRHVARADTLLPITSPQRQSIHFPDAEHPASASSPTIYSSMARRSTPTQANDNTFELRDIPPQYVSSRSSKCPLMAIC